MKIKTGKINTFYHDLYQNYNEIYLIPTITYNNSKLIIRISIKFLIFTSYIQYNKKTIEDINKNDKSL